MVLSMIREATIVDSENCLKILKDFAILHNKSITFNRVSDIDCKNILRQSIQKKSRCVFLTPDNKGIFIGALYNHPFTNRLFSCELVWFSETPKYSFALLKTFEKWSKENKAEAIQVHSFIPITGDRLDRIYKKRNYKSIDKVFLKEV